MQKTLRVLFPVLFLAVAFGVSASFVSAATDGSGTMGITPATATEAATGLSFTFDFQNTGASKFAASSEITLSIPVGWTAPQTSDAAAAGYVAATNGASSATNSCNPGTIGVSGTGPWTLTIPQTCGINDHLTVTYSGITAPAAGTYAFATQSQNGPAGLAAIASSPSVVVSAVSQVTPPSTVHVYSLQPDWTATDGGQVYSAYYAHQTADDSVAPVSPGQTAVYDGRQAGVIKAGQNGLTWDEGLFGFKPNMTIAALASGPLAYDVQNETGTNPVWMTIEVGDPINRDTNLSYQYVPAAYGSGWHTIDAAAGAWQLMDANGNATGTPMTLSDIAAAHPGQSAVRVYLRLGMGSSYLGTGTGTKAWVDTVTIGTTTYEFGVSCASGPSATLAVDATQHIANDPDSGNFGGNWALDTFDRHIQIWQEGAHYCAQADDNGTFTTFGGTDGKSPESGAALPEIVTGTMIGGTHGVIAGTLGNVGGWGTTTPAIDCSTDAALCASGLTAHWVQNYFPGGTYTYNNGWSWTYNGGANGTWVNSTMSSGDIKHIIPPVVYVSPTGSDSNDGSVTRPFATIGKAMLAVADAGTVKVYPGDYDIARDNMTNEGGQTGWYLPITRDGITLEGVTADGQVITDPANVAANIFSTQASVNGAWSSQDLIAVFSNNVTIQGLGIMNKLSPNKGIEVMGNNFKAQYDLFAPIPLRILPTAADYTDPDGSQHNNISNYGSGVYFNNNGATAARTGTVANNIFDNSGVTFDSFGNNWTMSVSHNVFDGNKTWDDSYYSAVGATTWANQPDFTGSTITVTDNSFLNMASGQPLLKIKSGMTGSFNASRNWWGTAGGPGSGTIVENGGTITTAPWYSDAKMSTLVTGVPSVLGDEASTTLPVAITETGTDGGVTVTAEIPQGTVITGSSSWDGALTAPSATTTTVSVTGYDTTVTSAIAVGSSDTDLTFDQAVKLTFAGQAGKRVGWYNHAGTFTEITDTCAANDQATGNALAAGTSCKIDATPDLVVWTKHFSTFTTYSTTLAAPVISPNGGVFHGSIEVTMDASASGAFIRYTTDGSTPDCTAVGNTYNGTLTFHSATTLTAIRCDATGHSTVASATFSPYSGNGGSSGGGGSIAATPAVPATPTVAPATPAVPATPAAKGKVLGAEAYNFTKDLHMGSTGDDVT
ncbi:MAG TPA: chitobiase/beta-hexosaminidase C-terminal domain-containing protein, partial [Chloroflexota bacterium]